MSFDSLSLLVNCSIVISWDWDLFRCPPEKQPLIEAIHLLWCDQRVIRMSKVSTNNLQRISLFVCLWVTPQSHYAQIWVLSPPTYTHITPTDAGLRGVATIMQFHLTHTLRLPHLNTYHSSVPALVVNDCWWWSLLYLTGKITSGSKSWANFSEESEMFSFTLYLLVCRFCTADCILRRVLYPIGIGQRLNLTFTK